MIDDDQCWRNDLTEIPARDRRLARFALGLIFSETSLRERLNYGGALDPLWELTRGLLRAEVDTALREAASREDEHEGPDPADRQLELELERQLTGRSRIQTDAAHVTRRAFYQHLPSGILTRLDRTDANQSGSRVAELLSHSLGLDTTALRLLEFLDLRNASTPFHELLNAARSGCQGWLAMRHNAAGMLGLDERRLRSALGPRSPLRRLGLIEVSGREHCDIEDFVMPSDLLSDLLEAEPTTEAELLALLVEPAPTAAWPLCAFPHLREATQAAQEVISSASREGVQGVNALFYGPPGTGKTELARTLAAAAGLSAFQVASVDDDGEGHDGKGRLAAYLVAQRLLAKRRDAVLIFDEVEDVITQRDSLFALLSGNRPTGEQKGWMNRILEENPVPAIWITNETRDMDPAFQRRFLLPMAFVTPPRSVRRQIAERHLGDRLLPPSLLDELAADEALAPAHLGAAARVLELRREAPRESTVRQSLAAIRQLLHGAPAPRRREAAMDFDVAYLNLAGGIHPNALVQALEREGAGRLCFYGPPGTGKTAFAELLATALDRELIARQASDLVSPYVGETEQNLARLFASIDAERSLLLLDEVDSLLADRRQAQHNWERTQVNELLQQMERFSGIFIAATNLMSGVDTAALRRFDFKLHFRALKPQQRLALFAREALGDEGIPVPVNLARHLERLETLTPGDFANVRRQQRLLGETLEPDSFLKQLIAESRLKEAGARSTSET